MVADWLVTWLETRARLRENARRGYAAHIHRYLIPHLGTVLLAELHIGHLEKVFTALLKKQGMSAATARRVHSTLRSALNAAVRERLLADNPARYLKLPRGRRPHAVVWTRRRVKQWQRSGARPVVAVWTPTQTAAFLNAITGHRLHAAYHLIALRGLRRGEAVGLRWCDVDLDHQVAYISWQLQYIAGELVLCRLKTEASRRMLAMDATTVQIMRLHRRAQEDYCRANGLVPSGYVFTGADGGPLSPEYLTRTFGKLIKETGLPPVRLHDLRHGGQPGAGRRGGPESDRRPARALQHRADRRHLHQRGHRTRPGCGRGGRPADPARGQAPARRQDAPPGRRPAAGRHRRLNHRRGTAPTAPGSHPARHHRFTPSARRPGKR
jgi:integrase